MVKNKLLLECPNCKSNNIVKKGIRKNKLQFIQQYKCKSCSRIFKQSALKNKTYLIQTILKAISLYNKGFSLDQVKQKIKTKATLPTISNWINEYKNITTFNKLRKEALKLYTKEEIIEKHTFMHNNLPYTFQVHKAKLELLFKNKLYNNKFSNTKKFQKSLIDYLNKIPTSNFPHHIFKEHKEKQSSNTTIAQFNNIKNNNLKNKPEQRASQLKFPHLKITHLSKNNLANKLTSLSLNLAKNNKQRHEAVQNFMLINDSTTIAAEIPVYLTKDDITYFLSRKFTLPLENQQTPITGHIDILQIRNNLIHILDYKPEANKQKPIEQLTIYALALASKLKLDLKSFKCAWFDENNYFEFFPLHVVYEKP